MSNRTILFDTSPLGLVTHPNPNPDAIACKHWLQNQIALGARIIVPEITDYELRRELLRAKRSKGIALLDALIQRVDFLAINTEAMKRAAEFWALARQSGYPTSHDHALDADVILAAQAITLNDPNIIVVTQNVKHLAPFVSADVWQNIR